MTKESFSSRFSRLSLTKAKQHVKLIFIDFYFHFDCNKSEKLGNLVYISTEDLWLRDLVISDNNECEETRKKERIEMELY